MRLFVRQMKHIAKASVVLNVVVVLFFFVEFLATRVGVPGARSGAGGQGPDRDIFVVPRSNQEMIKESCSAPKKVLMFGMKQHWFEFCKFPAMKHIRYLVDFPRAVACPMLPCGVSVTYSDQAVAIRGADIVVFTNVYGWLSPAMWAWAQGNRTEGQPWVMVSLDSPLYVPGMQPPDSYNERTYNMLASYKLDSDVYIPYGFYQKSDSPDTGLDLGSFWDHKFKMVAWISSNCETIHWDRRKFVNDFKSALSVDTFGKCGGSMIPWGDEKAVADILSSYKFYLSLENSCCDDYVTEKFWRALDLGVVPIVVGASYEQYLRVAPPNSFIHVDQFGSLAELVTRVLEIGNDRGKYLEYLKWRTNGRVVTHSLEEQYVSPLSNSTFCAVLDRYLKTSREDRGRFIAYNGPKWKGSCRECGSKWIRSYMRTLRVDPTMEVPP